MVGLHAAAAVDHLYLVAACSVTAPVPVVHQPSYSFVVALDLPALAVALLKSPFEHFQHTEDSLLVLPGNDKSLGMMASLYPYL